MVNSLAYRASAIGDAFLERISPILTTKEEIEKTILLKLEMARTSLFHEKNLIRVERQLGDLKEMIAQSYKTIREGMSVDVWQMLEAEITASQHRFLGEVDGLASSIAKEKEYDMQKRWVEFDMPEDMLSTHPDCVSFLMKSGLGRLLVMFQNSTTEGNERHQIRFDTDGMPLIKMQDEWVRWTVIQGQLTYDEATENVLSKKDGQVWTYVSPHGLVPKSRFDYISAYPVEQLNDGEYQELLTHAATFWESVPEADPGVEKSCIFQVVSTHRDYVPENWATKNLRPRFPEHISMRIVDSQGRVYSFGLQMPKSEEKSVIRGMPWSFLTTAMAKMPAVDYEEPRHQFDYKRVTSFTMSEERKEALLSWIEARNREHVTFSFGKQNCSRVTSEALKLAGVEMNAQIYFPTYVWNILPSLEDVPFIGKQLCAIASFVRPIFATLHDYAPTPIRWVISKIPTMAAGLFAITIGGFLNSSTVEQLENASQSPNDAGTPRFKRMMRHWYDIFDDEVVRVYHSSVMAEWQEKQKSTVIYSATKKPRLCLLPSQATPRGE